MSQWRRGRIVLIPKDNQVEKFREAVEEIRQNVPQMLPFMEGADKSEEEEERKGHIGDLFKGLKKRGERDGEATAFLYTGNGDDVKHKGGVDEEDDDNKLVYDGDDADAAANPSLPSQDRKSRETVRIVDDDIERLDTGTWLNDNLVDLWFKMVADGDEEAVDRVMGLDDGEEESDDEEVSYGGIF